MYLTLIELLLFLLITLLITFTSIPLIRRKSLWAFLWIFLIYFVYVPLLLEVVISIYNRDYFKNIFYDAYPGLPISLDTVDYFYLYGYVFIFILSLAVSTILLPLRITGDDSQFIEYRIAPTLIFTIIQIVALLVFLRFNNKPLFETSFGEQQSGISLFAAYFMVANFLLSMQGRLLRLNGFWPTWILVGLPTLFLSFLTSQRPWALFVLGAIMYRGLMLGHGKRIHRVIVVTFIFVFSFFVLLASRILANGKIPDFNLLMLVDHSSYVLWFLGASHTEMSGSTGGSGLLVILTNGWWPDFLIQRSFVEEGDVGFIVASEMRNWTWGSMHPTLPGFALVDQGLLGFALPLVLVMIYFVYKKYLNLIIGSSDSIFILIFIGTAALLARGTAISAFSKVIPILFFCSFNFFLIWLSKKILSKATKTNHSKSSC